MSAVNINNFREALMENEAYILLDVRTPQEYREGHLPGSINIPLQNIEDADELSEDKTVSIYVYCQSGARSSRAMIELSELGYTNVKNLGGIAAYTGKVES